MKTDNKFLIDLIGINNEKNVDTIINKHDTHHFFFKTHEGQPFSTRVDVYNIARQAHQLNKQWCEYNDDMSQVDWEECPEWQKRSAITGVLYMMENDDAGDSALHDSWMQSKLNDGWRYGEVKDETAQTHPCIVAFDQLPKHQQFKDRLFHSIVKASLEAALWYPTVNNVVDLDDTQD